MNQHRTSNASLTTLVALVAAVCVAGCDGSNHTAVDNADGLGGYRQQTLTWKACDLSDLPPPMLDMISPDVLQRLQCTDMRVPRNYAQPADGELTIALSRVQARPSTSAATSARKAEPLFFNPGGPGGDGYWFSIYRASDWFTGSTGLMPNSDSAQQKLYAQLEQTFDLIGFAPRGVGKSSPLTCASTHLLEPADHSLAGRNLANIEAQQRNTAALFKACTDNPLTPFINTDATARDMDLMRAVLGSEKLHFIGASYGTWLSMWYAGLFPEKTGRMVLDSSVDFNAPLSTAMVNQGFALTRTFDEVLAPYAARHPQVYGLGSDAQTVKNTIHELPPVIRAATARAMYDALISSSSAPTALRLLLSGKALSQPPFVALWPNGTVGGDFPQMRALIAQHSFSADAPTNAQLRESALDIVSMVEPELQARPVLLRGKDSVYTAVMCNDVPETNTDPQWWADQETRMLRDFPIAGTEDFRACLQWPQPANVRKPSIDSVKHIDFLMLQSQFDGATPAEGAFATFEKLPNAHMVYVKNEMTHGVYPYYDPCVDLLVGHYLLGSSPKERLSTCEGRSIEDKLSLKNTPSNAAQLFEKKSYFTDSQGLERTQ